MSVWMIEIKIKRVIIDWDKRWKLQGLRKKLILPSLSSEHIFFKLSSKTKTRQLGLTITSLLSEK